MKPGEPSHASTAGVARASDPLHIDEQPLDCVPLVTRVGGGTGVAAQAAREASAVERLDLCALAIELWRIRSRLQRVTPLLPARDARPLESSLARIEGLLVAAGVTTDDPEGRPYAEGDRVDVLLFEPHETLERATVLQTVKPAVLRDGSRVRSAEVIVGVPSGDARARRDDP